MGKLLMMCELRPTAFLWAICTALLTFGIFEFQGTDPLASDALPQSGGTTARPARPDALTGPECVISAEGIGSVRLGDTIDHVRRTIPSAQFRRTSDGDGAALVEVTFGGDMSVTLWADEDDAEAPIAWSRTIRTIETFSSNCHTIDGIHPRMLVVDVEKVFGPVKRIVKSEIESREYISFERQPASFALRLDYTGEFPEGSRETRRFSAAAKIYSIVVSSLRTP